MSIGSHQILVWLHIVLLVFWLGADVGVFASAAWVKRRGMPIEHRMLLLRLGGFVDLFPRICMAFMLPVGVSLASDWGLPVAPTTLPLLWSFSVLWSASVIVAYRSEGTALARRIGLAQRAVFTVAGLVCLYLGRKIGMDLAVPTWLALKLALFGLVFFVAIGIDLTFGPVIRDLMRLATEGSTDALEASFSRAINRCLVVVSCLYALLLVESFLGSTKFIS